jgi:hypothetical protein
VDNLWSTGGSGCASGRSGGRGPRHVGIVREQRFEQLHKLLPLLAWLLQEFRELDLVGLNGIPGAAKVAALLFVLDEQPGGFGIERKS